MSRVRPRGALPVCALLACALIALTLAGCGRLADYVRVVDANRLHDRGDYQGAIVSYMKADRAAFPATLDYDLANVYARLGEYEAAGELYAAARRGGDRAIAQDAWFNEGVALFERGRYEDSWKAFRAALAGADPASALAREGRRNLELAWRAWKKSGLAPPQGVAASSRGSSPQDESELRLLQRLETGRWKPGTKAPPPSGASDY